MIKIEYIWLDGYKPEPNLRSKIKVIEGEIPDLSKVPEWNFDGSSTKQAEGYNSDGILKPVRLYREMNSIDKVYVLCEVMNPDGTPHESNHRDMLGDEVNDMWFGFEQEYFIQEGVSKPILGFNRPHVEGRETRWHG